MVMGGKVGGFRSWCWLQGWVPPMLVDALSRPEYLWFLLSGFNAGEDGQNRTMMARTIKFRGRFRGEAQRVWEGTTGRG